MPSKKPVGFGFGIGVNWNVRHDVGTCNTMISLYRPISSFKTYLGVIVIQWQWMTLSDVDVCIQILVGRQTRFSAKELHHICNR